MEYYFYLGINLTFNELKKLCINYLDEIKIIEENDNNIILLHNNFSLNIHTKDNNTLTFKFLNEDYSVLLNYSMTFEIDFYNDKSKDFFSQFIFYIINCYNGNYLLLDNGSYPILKKDNSNLVIVSSRIFTQNLNIKYLNIPYQIKELE